MKKKLIVAGALLAGLTFMSGCEKEQSEEVQLANIILDYTNESLKEDNFRHTLFYLEELAGSEHKPITEPIEFEEVFAMAAKASGYIAERSQYDSGYATLIPKLKVMLNELEKEQTKEMGRDSMETIIKGAENTLGKSTAYALWTYYNLEMNRNDTLEEAHQDMRDYFAKADNTRYGRMLGFKAVVQSDEDFDEGINYLLEIVEDTVLKKEEPQNEK